MEMIKLAKGILIALEGIDGSGKSTLAQSLESSLTQFPIIITKEPGATPLGKQLREILQAQEVPVHSKAEYLLFAADRAQHFAQTIIPYLNKKHLIISDRMSDSSLVYQGFGRGLDHTMLATINNWAMDKYKPDLTLYLKIDPILALHRIQKRRAQLTVFEKERMDFTQKLLEGFETLYKDRNDVIQLDAQQTIEHITQQATIAIITWIQDQQLIVP
jgi:dTMP kinase